MKQPKSKKSTSVRGVKKAGEEVVLPDLAQLNLTIRQKEIFDFLKESLQITIDVDSEEWSDYGGLSRTSHSGRLKVNLKNPETGAVEELQSEYFSF